jgi:hypothetical protein
VTSSEVEQAKSRQPEVFAQPGRRPPPHRLFEDFPLHARLVAAEFGARGVEHDLTVGRVGRGP